LIVEACELNHVGSLWQTSARSAPQRSVSRRIGRNVE
jgi:hypothetical protein